MSTAETTNAQAIVRYGSAAPVVYEDPTDRPIARNLPANLLDDQFVMRFLGIFEHVLGTVTSYADGLEHLANPAVAPPRMVETWIRCLGFDAVTDGRPDFTLSQKRALLAHTGELITKRGTIAGLRRMLELILGTDDDVVVPVKITDNGDVVAAGERARSSTEHPKVEIELPYTGGFRTADLIELIRCEIPAHVWVSIGIRSDEDLELIYNGPAVGPVRGI